jgi:hypothetical protein
MLLYQIDPDTTGERPAWKRTKGVTPPLKVSGRQAIPITGWLFCLASAVAAFTAVARPVATGFNADPVVRVATDRLPQKEGRSQGNDPVGCLRGWSTSWV